ncbi:MAG: DUF2946 family protein [Candidatus Eisenbacteria bacterium]
MGTLIRRYALLVAALLVLTGAAGAAHVHGGDSGSAPLDSHSHSTCAYCVHAGNTPEPAIGVSVIPPVEPLRFQVAPRLSTRPAATPRSPARGRAPPR